MVNRLEILRAIPDQYCTIELRIAAHVVVVARIEPAILPIQPFLLWAINAIGENGLRVAILGRRGQMLAPLQDQDTPSGRGKCCSQRRAPHAGANYDDIRIHQAGIRFSVAGSKATAFSMFTAKVKSAPGFTSASERIRAITSRPPRVIDTKVSEPAGSVTTT